MRQAPADSGSWYSTYGGRQLRAGLHRSWLTWLAASERRQLRRVALWDPQAAQTPARPLSGDDCS